MASLKALSLTTACAVIGLSTAASAVTFYEGNDCAGVFGQGFENCTVDGSPIIYKDDVDEGAEINTLYFPSIDGSEFEWNYTSGDSVGTWTYTPGEDDPLVTHVVAKGGSGFNLFTGAEIGALVDGKQTGTWFTPDSAGLSHISFYDTGIPPIPVPAAGWMMIAGLGGLAAVRRRKARKA